MDKKCEQDAPEEVSRKPRVRVVKRSGGRSGNHLLLLKIPFSRLDSSPATGEDGENAEVEKRGRSQIPDACPPLSLSCRSQNLVSGSKTHWTVVAGAAN